jgi:serine/threonine-protein kinase
VLYEMLTGRQAFPGETASDSIAGILGREPDWQALPSSTPLKVRELLQRCLRKDNRNRLHDIADARIEIEEASSPEDHGAPPARRHVSRVVLGALTVLAAVSIFVAGWSLYASRADRSVTRLTVSMPVGYEITSAPAISPDGRLVAYTARDDADRSGLYVRGLNEYVPRLLVSTGEPFSPFFSPDGRHLGFFGDDQLWRVDVSGGAPTALADAPIAFGGTWGPQGDIVFTPNLNSGLVRIKASGGVPEQLTVPDFADAGYAHVWPHYDDDGRGLTFTIWGRGDRSTARLSIESLQWERINVGLTHARRFGSRYLLQSDQDGGLRTVLFDANDAQVRSEPISVLTTPIHYTYSAFRPWYDIAANGNLIYVPTTGFKHHLTWVTRESGETEEITEDEAAEIALSPDGEKVLYTSRGSLWMYDLVRDSRTQIESQPMIFTPEWDPDGDRVYFSANRSGDWDLYTKLVTGTSPATRLLEKPNGQHVSGIAKDGTIAFWETPPESRTTLWIIPPGEQPRLFLDSEFGASRGRFSPSGDLLAYTVVAANQSHAEVFVISYPQRVQQVKVSRDGGQEPIWSPDGKELFYRKGDDILSVSVSTDDGLQVGIPRVELHDLSIAKTWANYRISPDGKRFLVLQRDPAAVPRQINVILNWRREFDERVSGM